MSMTVTLEEALGVLWGVVEVLEGLWHADMARTGDWSMLPPPALDNARVVLARSHWNDKGMTMTTPKLKVDKVVLVYQGGIANVFSVTAWLSIDNPVCGRTRLLQSDFRSCEWYCRGLQAAGVEVRTAACNRAGDIAGLPWDTPIDEAPFRNNFGWPLLRAGS